MRRSCVVVIFVLVVYHPTKSPFEKGFLKDCALNSEPTG